VKHTNNTKGGNDKEVRCNDLVKYYHVTSSNSPTTIIAKIDLDRVEARMDSLYTKDISNNSRLEKSLRGSSFIGNILDLEVFRENK